MATDRFHLCPKCGRKSWAGSLFDSLLSVALGTLPTCAQCATNMALHLSFAWGLDAGAFQCVVLDAFLPEEPVKWPDKTGREVTFYRSWSSPKAKVKELLGCPIGTWSEEKGKSRRSMASGLPQWASTRTNNS